MNYRKILTTLAVLSVNAAIGGTFAAPSYAAPAPTSEVTPVAFQCQCGGQTNWFGVPGESAPPAFLSSSGGMAAGTSPSEAVLANGDTAVAFQGADGDLWTFLEDPITGVGKIASSGLGMAYRTSPSITIAPNGEAFVAFQANTGDLWTWAGVPGTSGSVAASTGRGMSAGTSPSAALDVDQSMAVAFQANTGDLWTWSGLPGTAGFGALSTGLGMRPFTSPSIVNFGGEDLNVAFQANTGILWEWEGEAGVLGFGFSTGFGMEQATSPSITTEVNDPNNSAIAFQANTGLLWTWVPDLGGTSTGLGMASGTSPSITALASGGAAVAFQANTGALWTWNGNAGTLGFGASTVCNPPDICADGGFAMAAFTSPSIGFDIAPHGFSLTAKGNVLAQLRKPRTLDLLVYSTPKPPAPRHTPPPLKLLGRVALGQHPAGLSQIACGLRVHGRRLGAGHYLADLEALIGRALTTGGPTVTFDVGKRGKLMIVAQSCPARAPAATVC